VRLQQEGYGRTRQQVAGQDRQWEEYLAGRTAVAAGAEQGARQYEQLDTGQCAQWLAHHPAETPETAGATVIATGTASAGGARARGMTMTTM